jgi:hypothetical protein
LYTISRRPCQNFRKKFDELTIPQPKVELQAQV